MSEINKITWFKYTILRRLITNNGTDKEQADLSTIQRVCLELEGRTMEQLEEIHKREIGY